MDIKTIGVEDWLNVWEKSATYDIAQSTIASMTMGEILQLDGQADEQGFAQADVSAVHKEDVVHIGHVRRAPPSMIA